MSGCHLPGEPGRRLQPAGGLGGLLRSGGGQGGARQRRGRAQAGGHVRPSRRQACRPGNHELYSGHQRGMRPNVQSNNQESCEQSSKLDERQHSPRYEMDVDASPLRKSAQHSALPKQAPHASMAARRRDICNLLLMRGLVGPFSEAPPSSVLPRTWNPGAIAPATARRCCRAGSRRCRPSAAAAAPRTSSASRPASAAASAARTAAGWPAPRCWVSTRRRTPPAGAGGCDRTGGQEAARQLTIHAKQAPHLHKSKSKPKCGVC